MKTYKHLWEKLITEENFELAYKNVIKNKSGQRQIKEFKKDAENNLKAVRQMVIDGKFHTSKYKQKKIYEPKERIIYKLPFNPDRIVQHAIMNVLKPILMNKLIDNTYACIEGRGQLKASLRCSEFVRRNRYCLKCDIKQFYPSIDQNILSGKLHRIIKDDRFMEIVDDVIFSFPGGKNCPIGNYMSQWLGNYYLSFMDNYILHTLKCDGYERYCDDFLIFGSDKVKLKQDKREIREFLQRELQLDFSKAEIFDVKQGVDFCGYRHFGKYVLIRKKTALRLKRRFSKIQKALDAADYDIQKITGQLTSGNGLMKHACSYRFRQSVRYKELMDYVGRNSENTYK